MKNGIDFIRKKVNLSYSWIVLDGKIKVRLIGYKSCKVCGKEKRYLVRCMDFVESGLRLGFGLC